MQPGRVMPVLLRFEISCIKCKGLEADVISGGEVGDCQPEVESRNSFGFLFLNEDN